MWDKKGEDISFNWFYKLKERLLKEQQEAEFSGERESTEALAALSDEELVKYASARANKCNSMGNISVGNPDKEKVALVQKALVDAGANITDPAGTFGATTLIATIAAQKQTGVRTDGCVGPETIEALGIKGVTSAGPEGAAPSEGKPEVPIATWYGKIVPSKGSRNLGSVNSIVLHDTLTSLGGMIATFSRPRTYTKKSGEQSTYFTGTHFSIDKSGKVRQHAPLNRGTNHTATSGWNGKSIGIDMVTRAGGVGAGYIGFEPPTPAQLAALYELVNQLTSKIPSINKKVHWIDDGEKNNAGWQLGGKQYSPSDGVVSHGMVQGNRADATLSSYYLKLRADGMSHSEAYKKAVEDEEQARVRYASSGRGSTKMKRLQRVAQGKGRKAARAKRALKGIEAIQTRTA